MRQPFPFSAGATLAGPRSILAVGFLLACACGADRDGAAVAPQGAGSRLSASAPARSSISEVDDHAEARSAKADPRHSLPPSPDPPQRPEPLEVEGFAQASHVGPDPREEWPAPVTIVLHGNFDRPEWECDTWQEVAGFHGWILCPRGVRTPWATRREDRWTYNGAAAVRREIDAALAALEARYPGRVSREDTVLAGFSLGAILAPALIENDPGRYPYVFLVEGGLKKLDRRRARGLVRAGVRGAGIAMSGPGRRNMALDVVRWLTAAGARARFVDMRGAGHAYRGDFGVTGRRALEGLLGGTTERDGGIE